MIPAAQYLRMSTDHQRFSLGNQAAAIGAYAIAKGYDVVASYEDAGKSGLTIGERHGLKSLLADAVSGDAPFAAILVLDISRWGRFQDPDQAAHYEFICREAGIEVVYCAEAFENDGSTVTSIVKHLKRIMAAEYSRELSEKTRASKRRRVPMGHMVGGSPAYGVRRQVIDDDGCAAAVMERGHHKAFRQGHTVLIRGPSEEVQITKDIFRLFVDKNLTLAEIARRLNSRGLQTSTGKPWGGANVKLVLGNELAIGNYVYGRTEIRLKGKQRRTPPEDWIRIKLFPGIVSTAKFEEARKRLLVRERGPHLTKPQILMALKRLLKEKGRLSAKLIDKCLYTPKAFTCASHFGSLRLAYEAVGYVRQSSEWRGRSPRVPPNADLIKVLRRLHREHGYLSVPLMRAEPDLPSIAALTRRFGTVLKTYEAAGFPISHSDVIRASHRRRMAEISGQPADE